MLNVKLTCPCHRPRTNGQSRRCRHRLCSGTTCGTYGTSDTVQLRNTISDCFSGIRVRRNTYPTRWSWLWPPSLLLLVFPVQRQVRVSQRLLGPRQRRPRRPQVCPLAAAAQLTRRRGPTTAVNIEWGT